MPPTANDIMNTACKRPPRILWANYFCLLDTSSGASISARQILLQLQKLGIEIKILGATIFDGENGARIIQRNAESIEGHKIIDIEDGSLVHQLLNTNSIHYRELRAEEINQWTGLYCHTLNQFKPDLVMFYGGNTPDYLIPAEARARGIPTLAYVVNGNYPNPRWCRDVDMIFTDSKATAQFYQDSLGLDIKPCGTFIEASSVVADTHTRENLLFVNPRPEKGAYIVVQIAKQLLEKRPDIKLEVIESRGSWSKIVEVLKEPLKLGEKGLPNVTVTPNTDDMRPIYARTRAILALSVWWESGSRVLCEAMLNGIPAVVTDRGGSPEMIGGGQGGVVVRMPEEIHERPYNRLPNDQMIDAIVDKLIGLYDDEDAYQQLAQSAKQVGKLIHNMDRNTQTFYNTIKPLLDQCAGDSDIATKLNSQHKLGLVELNSQS